MKDTIPVAFQSSCYKWAHRVRQRRKLWAEFPDQLLLGFVFVARRPEDQPEKYAGFSFPPPLSLSLSLSFCSSLRSPWVLGNIAIHLFFIVSLLSTGSLPPAWRAGDVDTSAALLAVLLKFPPLIFCCLSVSLSLFHPVIFCPSHFPLRRHFPLILSSGYPTFFFFVVSLFLFSPAPSFTFAVNRSDSVSAHRQACCWRIEMILRFPQCHVLSWRPCRLARSCAETKHLTYFFSGTILHWKRPVHVEGLLQPPGLWQLFVRRNVGGGVILLRGHKIPQRRSRAHKVFDFDRLLESTAACIINFCKLPNKVDLNIHVNQKQEADKNNGSYIYIKSNQSNNRAASMGFTVCTEVICPWKNFHVEGKIPF